MPCGGARRKQVRKKIRENAKSLQKSDCGKFGQVIGCVLQDFCDIWSLESMTLLNRSLRRLYLPLFTKRTKWKLDAALYGALSADLYAHIHAATISQEPARPFPPRLTSLSVSTFFAGTLSSSALPTTLQSLNVSARISFAVFPSSLTGLTLLRGLSLDFDIGKNLLPPNLLSLSLSIWTGAQPLPSSLTELHINTLIDSIITLPPGLRKLTLSYARARTLANDVLPEGLETLHLDSLVLSDWRNLVLPQSLTDLDAGGKQLTWPNDCGNGNQKLVKLSLFQWLPEFFPSSVRHLSLQFHDLTWPSNLRLPASVSHLCIFSHVAPQEATFYPPNLISLQLEVAGPPCILPCFASSTTLRKLELAGSVSLSLPLPSQLLTLKLDADLDDFFKLLPLPTSLTHLHVAPRGDKCSVLCGGESLLPYLPTDSLKFAEVFNEQLVPHQDPREQADWQGRCAKKSRLSHW